MSLREGYRLAPSPKGYSGLRLGGSGSRRGLASRAVGKQSFLRHLDWLLILVVLALCVLGTLLVWSATQPAQLQLGASPKAYLYKSVLWFGIGLVLMVAVAAMDIKQIRTWTPVVYGLTLLGLLAVLTPLGSASAAVNGARSWINLPGGFQVEPSEFAKLGMVLICALFLGRLNDAGKRPGDCGRRRRVGRAQAARAEVLPAQPDHLVHPPGLEPGRQQLSGPAGEDRDRLRRHDRPRAVPWLAGGRQLHPLAVHRLHLHRGR
jgi:Cell cycle protein